MAFETKFPRNLRRGERMEVNGRTVTVARWHHWRASRVADGQELLLMGIDFEPIMTQQDVIHPRPIFVPEDQVVVVTL